jgi:hypothetical protein
MTFTNNSPIPIPEATSQQSITWYLHKLKDTEKIDIYRRNFQNDISILTIFQLSHLTNQSIAIQHTEKLNNGICRIICRALDTVCDTITKLRNSIKDFGTSEMQDMFDLIE